MFFDELGLRPPDHRIATGSGSHAHQTAAMLEGLEPVLAAEPPDLVLAYGDTNSTLAGALVAAKRATRWATSSRDCARSTGPCPRR